MVVEVGEEEEEEEEEEGLEVGVMAASQEVLVDQLQQARGSHDCVASANSISATILWHYFCSVVFSTYLLVCLFSFYYCSCIHYYMMKTQITFTKNKTKKQQLCLVSVKL